MTVKLSSGFRLQGGDDSRLEPSPQIDAWYVDQILRLCPTDFPVTRRVIDAHFPPLPRIEQEVSRILADMVKAGVLTKTRDTQRGVDFFIRVTTEKKPFRI